MTVEIKVGITHVNREVVVETDKTAEDISKELSKAIADGGVLTLVDDKGRKAKQAGPSTPVEVTGFSEVPEAGGVFMAVKDEKDARMVAAKEQLKLRDETMRKTSKVTLDDLFNQMADGDINLLAANNTSQQNTDSKGSSASIGKPKVRIGAV